MKYLLVFAFTIWACISYSQSAKNFANIPVRTENSNPFSATPKFQGTNTTGQGLGMLVNFKEDTLAMLLDHVSEKSLKKNLFFLASTNGDSVAADFITHWMAKHKLREDVRGYSRQLANISGNIAITEGSDKKAGYIIFIAHLNNKTQPFNGSDSAVDNSSTVALMECAKAVAALSREGVHPKRTIIFICATDKAHCALSTNYFTQYPAVSLSKINFELNIEMLSRKSDSNKTSNNYVYSLYYDSTYTAKSIAKNVNTPNSIPDKKNYNLLSQKTKLALGILWKLANE